MTSTDSEKPWAIITGASEGIGAAFAVGLDERQTHNLVLVARTKAKLEKVASSVKNVKTRILVEDLAAAGAAQKVFDATKDINVALLINNAGMAPGGNHEELDFATIQKTIALNVTVLTELMALFLPVVKQAHEDLREKRKASKYALAGIINVSSTSAFQPIPSMALYAATKSFILSLSESLYQEQRNIGCDVPIVCTLPGPVATEIWTKEGAFKQGLWINMDTVEHVIAATLRAFDSNRALIIPGYLNNIAVFGTRFSPRRVVRFLSRWAMGQDPALRDPKEVEETFRKLKESKKQTVKQ